MTTCRSSSLLLLPLLLVLVGTLTPSVAHAQWLDFDDETATRLTLSVATTDEEEKDIAVGDLDRDGDTDMIVARKRPFSNDGARQDFLLMNEDGVLVDRTATLAPGFVTTPTDARDVIFVDVDGDTWLDVLFINTFEDQPRLYMNQGDTAEGVWGGLVDESSTRLPTITVDPLQFCAGWSGDVDGVNGVDLYLVNYDPGGLARDVLLINDGTGVFTDESETRLGARRNSAFGTGVEIHDIDGDNDLDVIKTSTLFDVSPWNDLGVFILYNDGTGNFPTWEKVPSNDPYMFTLADFDQNNALDIYVVDDNTDYLDLVTARVSGGPLTYDQRVHDTIARTGGFGGNAKTADVDGDGDMDLGLADVDVDIPPCNSAREFALLRNEGLASGDLTDPYTTSLDFHTNAYDFDFIDINSDGQLDLVLGLCTGYQVFVQPPDLPFVDGFESGDTMAWSLTVGN